MGKSTFRRSKIVMGKDGDGKDILAYGITPGAYMLWDASADALNFANARQNWITTGLAITDALGNARQLYGQFTAISIADAEQLTAIQLRASWAGTEDETDEGIVGAEFKARADSDSITNTLKQARAVVGNVDAKKATFKYGYAFEAAIDIKSGGKIEEAIGFRSYLNKSGQVDHSYAFLVDAESGNPWEYGLYVPAGMAEKAIEVNAVDVAGANLRPIHLDAVMDGPVDYYYGMQSDVHKSGSDDTDDFSPITGSIEVQNGAAFQTTGKFAALQALIYGTGDGGSITKSGNGLMTVAWIANRGTVRNTDAILTVHNQSAAAAVDAIRMDLDGTITYAFKFNGTVCDGWTSGTGALTGADDYVLIPVRVEGVAQDLFIKAQKTWS